MPEQPRTFRVEQLGPPRGPNGLQTNEAVSDLDSMVMHHPGANRNTRMQAGRILETEDQHPTYRGGDRSYAYIDGEFQEIIDHSTDRYGSLKADQVLVVKDFILEDPAPPRGTSERAIGVPSPTAGYVSRIRDRGGMVEIMDRQGGDVIARVRHLNPISVQEGNTVVYGQSLGTQNRQGLRPNAGVHVHIEMDTRHHQQLQNYIDDLTSGRLPVQPELRANVQPQAIVNDGTFRLGQSDERIRDLQRVMANEGYQAAGNPPLDRDGVYRPRMQGALLDFQRDHGLLQTGNIDPATLRMAPPAPRRETDRQDHFDPGRPTFQGPHTMPPAPTAPWHPDHPDHRPLPPVLPPAVNQPGRIRVSTDMRDPLHPGHGTYEKILYEVHRMETTNGIKHGPNSERVAAALMVEAERSTQGITNVEKGTDNQIYGLQRFSAFDPEKKVVVNPNQALAQSMEHYSAQWLQARSSHYADQSPAVARTPEQAQALSQLPSNDQAIFTKIRQATPARISDDVVARTMLQAKRERIDTADKLENVAVRGDNLYIMGKFPPGDRTMVSMTEQVPALQETVQQTQAFNQHREQQLAQEQQQRQIDGQNQSGPKMV